MGIHVNSHCRAPSSLDGVLKRLSAQVDAETGYEFEVRRVMY